MPVKAHASSHQAPYGEPWRERARRLGVRIVASLPAPPDAALLEALSRVARDMPVVPAGRGPDGRIVLAAANPGEVLDRLEELEFALGPVEVVAADPEAVSTILSRGRAGSLPLAGREAAFTGWDGEDAPAVAKYVDEVIGNAVRAGASDVHFEPSAAGFRVRMRVDGVLRDLPGLPSRAGPAVVSRLKLLSGLDIGQTRLAQDGRIIGAWKAGGMDLRLATLPVVGGECAVLRLLDASRVGRNLGELGMPEACRAELAKVCRGHGLVVACGPTGSGKTTTLHAILRSLDAGARKTLTIEDPVEYELPGAVQVQARPELGLDFATALRSFLRHDPDVILVGEIRDALAARIAMRAALTGHLVLASLHCHEAAQAPLRLVELGMEPWLVGASLEMALSQRLLRKTCTRCAGVGCAECSGSGFAGRTAVFEWLRMDGNLAALLDAGTMGAFAEAAADALPTTMRREAARLVQSGLTSGAEVEEQIGVTSINWFRSENEDLRMDGKASEASSNG